MMFERVEGVYCSAPAVSLNCNLKPMSVQKKIPDQYTMKKKHWGLERTRVVVRTQEFKWRQTSCSHDHGRTPIPGTNMHIRSYAGYTTYVEPYSYYLFKWLLSSLECAVLLTGCQRCIWLQRPPYGVCVMHNSGKARSCGRCCTRRSGNSGILALVLAGTPSAKKGSVELG